MTRSLLIAALALAVTVAVTLPFMLDAPKPEPAEPLTPALESLRADRYAPHFGLEYWTSQATSETDEWHRAVAFCADASPERYPNCATVHLLETAGRIPGFLDREASRD